MSLIEIKVPSPGESISEVQIARWIKQDGDYVEKDEEIAEIDSDKATLTIPAEAPGILKTLAKEGDTVAVGAVVCTIDTEGKKSEAGSQKSEEKNSDVAKDTSTEKKAQTSNTKPQTSENYASGVPSPSAEKMMKEKNISAAQIAGTGKGGRITKTDVLQATPVATTPAAATSPEGSRNDRREKMTMLRKKVAERLVAVKQQTAMLTTFNEVDMSVIMDIRKKYKDTFKEKHGVGLGFMSFFTKAVCEALKVFPAVNALIDGEEIVYHDYCDIGIAVSAPKGLMVPVIRNAESLSLAQIESAVADLAAKARESKLTIEEMTGGTFTI